MCTILVNTLASSRKRGFLKKNTETHVALRKNNSASVRVTELVEVSKYATSKVHSKKNFLVGVADFL